MTTASRLSYEFVLDGEKKKSMEVGILWEMMLF